MTDKNNIKTWDDIDLALKDLGFIQIEIEKQEARMTKKIDAIKEGYKQLLVMRDGSILACYVIPDVVGNMIEGTYSPNYYVSFDSKSVVWT